MPIATMAAGMKYASNALKRPVLPPGLRGKSYALNREQLAQRVQHLPVMRARDVDLGLYTSAQTLFEELKERPISNIMTSSAVADPNMVEEILSDADIEMTQGFETSRPPSRQQRQSLRLMRPPHQQRLGAYRHQRRQARRNLKRNWYHLHHRHGQHHRYLQQPLRHHRLRPRNWYHIHHLHSHRQPPLNRRNRTPQYALSERATLPTNYTKTNNHQPPRNQPQQRH
jgi:hypothetical protein